MRDLREAVDEGRRLLGREEQEVQALVAQCHQLEARGQELQRSIQV